MWKKEKVSILERCPHFVGVLRHIGFHCCVVSTGNKTGSGWFVCCGLQRKTISYLVDGGVLLFCLKNVLHYIDTDIHFPCDQTIL